MTERSEDPESTARPVSSPPEDTATEPTEEPASTAHPASSPPQENTEPTEEPGSTANPDSSQGNTATEEPGGTTRPDSAPPREDTGTEPREGADSTGRPDSAPTKEDPVTERSDRRLTRSQEGRLITGVCAGLARYTRLDPIVFRLGFALLVLTTGVGVILYIGAFLLMAAPDGGPSKVERAGKRVFDGDTVLALLGAALAAGVMFGVVGHWGSGDGLAVAAVFGLVLLVARSRGVDLVEVARGLPERVRGRPLASWTPPAPAPEGRRTADGMVDLARLGRRTAPADPAAPDAAGPYGTDPYVREAHANPAGPQVAGTPPKRRRSYLTVLTLPAAGLTAAILHSLTGDRPGFGEIQIMIAGALAVVAAGLILGAWFGRDRKLITVGAIMSLALACTSIAGNAAVAGRAHRTTWLPAAAAQAAQTHKVYIGEGVVDLTTVTLAPRERLQVNAEVMLGVLTVRVPRGVRVEVDGHAYLGDITVDRKVTSGPGARVRRVLEPDGTAPESAPVIALRIRSKVGDMEVTRVPA